MSLEFNKAAAAILLTGIVIMGSGLIAEVLIHKEPLKEKAYIVEGVEAVGGAEVAAAAPVELPPVGPLLAAADIAAGQDQTKKCAVCHSFEKGGPNKVGPGLWNIVNADVGAHAGFAYSKAMAEFPGKWTYEDLNEFLYRPKAHIPGTKMVFAGLAREKDRADLIAYLRTLSDNPAPLP